MYPPGLTNRLNLYHTTNIQKAKIEFYQYYQSSGINAGVNAYTVVFRKQNGVYVNGVSTMNSLDWVYGEVHINEYRMGTYSNVLRESIIIHEMLHVYGLKDQYYDPYSIMYGYTLYNVTDVTPDANAVINSKY